MEIYDVSGKPEESVVRWRSKDGRWHLWTPFIATYVSLVYPKGEQRSFGEVHHALHAATPVLTETVKRAVRSIQLRAIQPFANPRRDEARRQQKQANEKKVLEYWELYRHHGRDAKGIIAKRLNLSRQYVGRIIKAHGGTREE